MKKQLRSAEGCYTKTPVKSQFGYHVIKVEDKRDAQPPAFDQVEPQVRQIVMQEKYSQIIDQAKAAQKVEIVEKLCARATTSSQRASNRSHITKPARFLRAFLVRNEETMSVTVSPLAPKSYPEMPALRGVRMATAAAGIKYKNRTDVLLMVFDDGADVAGVFTRSKCPSAL